MKNVLMIINPCAGKMNFRSSFYGVVKLLSDADYNVNVFFTRKRGDAEVAAEKCGANTDLIIACGGDGTLNETLCGIARQGNDVKIGYIPCGSTNDFAASIGIPSKPILAVRQILDDRFITLDLGKFNDRFFSYTASFGAFTAASYDTPQNLKNSLGHFAYILGAAKQLSSLKPIRMKVTSGTFFEEAEFIYGGLSNTRSIGGVYSLPEEEVTMSDGEFELMMIKKPAAPAGYINTLLNIAARNYDDQNLVFLHTDRVVFESEEEVPYTLDGEFGGSTKRAEISCLHSFYRINGEKDPPRTRSET